MTKYPPTQPISPSNQTFDNPESPSNPSIQQQLLHRTRVTIIKEDQDNLPKGCSPNIRKKIPVKNMLQYKRQRYYTLSNVEKINQNIQEEEKLNELEQPKKKNSLELSKKEMLVEEMKDVNKNYSQFIKEFKKTKPLYLIKEEEFKALEKVKFQLKKQEVLRKLKEYYKPISFEEIDQHEKQYLKNRLSYSPKRSNQINQQSTNQRKESPKINNQRGKSLTVSVEQSRYNTQQSKQGQSQSISKMRDHYDKIMNKSRRANLQSRSFKRNFSVKIEPSSTVETSPSLSKKQFNRQHSKSINYQSINSFRSSKYESLFLSAQNSPKHNRTKNEEEFKFDITQIQSEESREEREEEVEDYHLARFGPEPYVDEDNEFLLSIKNNVNQVNQVNLIT